ncbi:hypothetical protein M407DRAFT_17845 [Tulasnella calospora MUT 4182]|uniref:DUF6534 domain-containing protein n=1 Tax=Tulasnella calospora MUT 4182 TaxID=1051891 RepID=A0A0C3QUY0_9AGAM|nr:hypothetical protein M407DRAFT_17845 [Tulasnella calospora MUT 4182]
MFNPTIGKGPDVVPFAVEKAKGDPEGMLGPWFMALIGLTFMMGILAIQVIRYFSTFGYESPGLFAVVVACVVMSLAQWIIVVQVCWNWFVLQLFAVPPWQAWSSPIIKQTTVAVAQLFFAYRCYTLYGRNKMVLGTLIVGMLAAVALFTVAGVAISIDPYNFNLISQWTTPALCVNLVTDLAIAGMTLWKLGGHKEVVYSSNTNDILRRLRNLTIEAAVPPAICALMNMVFYLSLGATNLIFVWFAIMTPQFYIWSLLLTLNYRLRIRQTFNSPNDDEALSTHFEFANGPSSNRKRRQTDTHRTTVVFAPMTGTTYAPNASMGLVGECVGGGHGDNRREGDLDSKVYEDSLAGRSRSGCTGAESSPEPPPAVAINSVERRPSDPLSI